LIVFFYSRFGDIDLCRVFRKSNVAKATFPHFQAVPSGDGKSGATHRIPGREGALSELPSRSVNAHTETWWRLVNHDGYGKAVAAAGNTKGKGIANCLVVNYRLEHAGVGQYLPVRFENHIAYTDSGLIRRTS
jgi:hypothetical protein